MVQGSMGSALLPRATSREPVNILWIVGDDLGAELACYGAPSVRTPNCDRLAREGVRFTAAFTTAPVCSASRSALMTGCYQTSIGAHHHRSSRRRELPPGVRFLPHLFREAGWYASNCSGRSWDEPGKLDVNFRADEPYDGPDWRGRRPGQPFFAQVNIFEPHRPFVPAPDAPPDARTLGLPPVYPDHPVARADWAAYLASVEEFDRKVGRVLARIEEEGLADRTVVFLFGDNGRCHVRDKQFLYDGGIRIPLIVRWPGRLRPGTVRQHLVSAIDISAATIAAAGLPAPRVLHGTDFLRPGARGRTVVFAARDRCDETVDRIRCARTRDWKLIRNFYPERPWTQPNHYKETSYPMLPLMRRLEKEGSLTPEQAAFLAPSRPAEELYDLRRDPNETRNLASEPGAARQLARMRALLDEWMRSTADRGGEPEDPADVVQ